MTRPTTAPAGAPCWIDLLTSNAEASRRFYGGLMGWTATEPDPAFGGYFTFLKDGLQVGGCMTRQPEMQAPDGWSVYLASPDARATVQRAASRGAAVAIEPMDVADLGTMAAVMDPSGAPIGIWQPGSHTGFGIVYETGGPAWFELHTVRYAECLDFYRDVFGWTTAPMADTPDFRYTVLQQGEMQLAGVMDDSVFAPEGTPGHWLVYLAVEDSDAAAARVLELGGAVTREPEDTPYGRLVSITDPNGAALNLMGPNREAVAGAAGGEAPAAAG